MAAKPECKLTGTDGNIFALAGRATKVLKRAGQRDKVGEMTGKIFKSSSYEEALGIIQEYVEVI